jgi:hypothetical protein
LHRKAISTADFSRGDAARSRCDILDGHELELNRLLANTSAENIADVWFKHLAAIGVIEVRGVVGPLGVSAERKRGRPKS